MAPILLFWYFPFLYNSNIQNCIPELGFAQGSFYARPLAKCFDAKILLGKLIFDPQFFSFTTFFWCLVSIQTRFRQDSDKIQTKHLTIRQNSDKHSDKHSDKIQTKFRQRTQTTFRQIQTCLNSQNPLK